MKTSKRKNYKTYFLNHKEQFDNRRSNQKIPEQFVVFSLTAAHKLPEQT